MTLSGAEINEAIAAFLNSNLEVLDVRVGEVSLYLSRSDAASARRTEPRGRALDGAEGVEPVSGGSAGTFGADPVPAAVERAVQVDASVRAICSPTVGVFYRKPAPDKPPYVEVGDAIGVGDPVCTIEVMKMFTEVISEDAGTVVEILVEDGVLVEAGQTLVRVRPA